jgi:hypothetical protein
VASAAVVLLAPMTMAAASIEGSPLRDAIRGPFERLGIVSPEPVRDGGSSDGAAAPATPGAPTGSQADSAPGESAAADGGVETAPATEASDELSVAPAVEPVTPAAEEAPPAGAPPEPSPEAAVPPGEGEVTAPETPEGDVPIVGEDPVKDLLGVAPELGAEMPSP